MTKICVYEEPKEAPKEERKIFLRLVQQNAGVMVVVVNEDGNHFPCGNLILFTNEGTLKFLSGVNVPGIQTEGSISYIKTYPALGDD